MTCRCETDWTLVLQFPSFLQNEVPESGSFFCMSYICSSAFVRTFNTYQAYMNWEATVVSYAETPLPSMRFRVVTSHYRDFCFAHVGQEVLCRLATLQPTHGGPTVRGYLSHCSWICHGTWFFKVRIFMFQLRYVQCINIHFSSLQHVRHCSFRDVPISSDLVSSANKLGSFQQVLP